MSEELEQELLWVINHEEVVSTPLKREEIKEIYEEIERLNNIINELEKDLENIFEKMKEKEVKIEGRGYYYTDLIPIEDLLDKVKTLKGSDKE